MPRILVTGASGFLGSRIVQVLIERGFGVRALIRNSKKRFLLDHPSLDIFYGDLTDISSIDSALTDVDFVVHAAVDTTGSIEGSKRVTIDGTRDLLDLCVNKSIKKLVYISSCSVYGISHYSSLHIVDETSPLEEFPEHRGIYSWAKFEAEEIVRRYMDEGRVAITCLRPGTIYGPGGEHFSPMIGFLVRDKFLAVIDRKDFIIPLVYIDNIVDAIVMSLVNDVSVGKVYNVVDQLNISKKQYIDYLLRKLFPDLCALYFPYKYLAAAVQLQELFCKLCNRKPLITTYRLISSQNPVQYSSRKISQELGWCTKIKFDEAADRIITAVRAV